MFIKYFRKRKIIAVHNGSFHADDIFACTVIKLAFKNRRFKIIRTRDEEIIQKADFVVDVGGIYDLEKNCFDHHQVGGAGKRDNGIPYASFGLVWKTFGEKICNSLEIAKNIDQFLVQPIDANDNGVDICKPIYPNLLPYRINEFFAAFFPTIFEKTNKNKVFLKMVTLAKKVLKREIKKNKDKIKIKRIIEKYYFKATDKRIVIIGEPNVSRQDVWESLKNYSEPLFVIYQSGDSWNAVAMRENQTSYKNKKDFPLEWAGFRDEELQKISGIPDAIFCHNSLFLVGAKSKEGALQMAQKALEYKDVS